MSELTKSNSTSFEEWCYELVKLVKERDIEDFISPNMEDHRDGFDSDETPESELEEQRHAARANYKCGF